MRVAIQFPVKITSSCIWVTIPVNWIILHWYACSEDGRTFGHLIIKFSGMGRLTHFLRYEATSARVSRARGAPLQERRLLDMEEGICYLLCCSSCFFFFLLLFLPLPSTCKKRSTQEFKVTKKINTKLQQELKLLWRALTFVIINIILLRKMIDSLYFK